MRDILSLGHVLTGQKPNRPVRQLITEFCRLPLGEAWNY
jgi:hypothetical protein